jgi:hypothetical protein
LNLAGLSEKLLRPLTLIMVIIVFTYPVFFGGRFVAMYLDATTSAIVNNYTSVLTNIGIAINYFVYYAFWYVKKGVFIDKINCFQQGL